MKKSARKIAVADAETDPFQHGRVPQPFMWGYYDGLEYKSFTKTADFIGFLREQNAIVFAHNGGRFDWHYILPHVEPYTQFLVINGRMVRFKFGSAEIRDSFSVLPVPLADYQKTVIDYSWFEPSVRKKYLPKIAAYLKDDCVFLHKLVSQFIDSYGNAVTLASAAFKTFSKMQPDDKEQVTTGHNKNLHDLCKPYYYGGRTQAFETGVFESALNVYDINSAYPFAMTHNHPAGSDFYIRGADCVAPPSGQSFYDVDATSHGAFPIRSGDKLQFPVGERHLYSVTGWELLAGIETDTVKIHSIPKRIIFANDVTFQQYVSHFWNLKKASAKKSPDYIYAKLFLNSLYGKMAANPDNYNKYMSVPRDCMAAATQEDWKLAGILPSGDLLVSHPLDEVAKHYYNMATAASITGYVRAMLWKAICNLRSQGARVLYCDTDSVLTDGTLAESNELGAWKLELQATLAAIAGRKLYALQKSDGTGWKTASKGAQLSSSEILRVARGETVTYRSAAPTFSMTETPSFIKREISRVL